MRGRWNSQLFEQERCAISFACTSCWSSKMVCLQQVILLSTLSFILCCVYENQGEHVQKLIKLNMILLLLFSMLDTNMYKLYILFLKFHLYLIFPNSFVSCWYECYAMYDYDISISVLDYELRDLEIPTITVAGKLVKEGIPVLVYRYMFASLWNENSMLDQIKILYGFYPK